MGTRIPDWKDLDAGGGETAPSVVPDSPAPSAGGAVPDWRELAGGEPDAAEAPAATKSDGSAPDESPKEFAERTGGDKSSMPERGTISDAELKAISERNGVPVERLRELSPWFGVLHSESGIGDALKAGTWGMSDVVLAGVPQNAIKKATLSTAEQRALDDVAALDRSKTSYWDVATDLVAGVAAPGGPLSEGVRAVAAGIKGGTKAASAAKAAVTVGGGVASGAVAGSMGAETGREKEGAVFGGVIGGALGAVSPIVSHFAGKSAREGRMAEQLATGIDESLEAKAAELAPGERKLDDALWKVLSDDKSRAAIRKDPRAFAASLPDDVQRLFFEAKRGTPEADPIEDVGSFLNEALDSWHFQLGHAPKSGASIENLQGSEAPSAKAAEQGISDFTEEAFRRSRDVTRARRVLAANAEAVTGRTWKLGRWGRKVSDARYVASGIDDKFGTKVEPAVDRLSAGINQAQGDVLVALHKAREPIAETRAALRKGASEEDIYRALEAGDAPHEIRALGLSPEVTKAAIAWRDWLDSVLAAAQSMGSKITKLEAKAGRAKGYVPNRTLPGPEYIAAVGEKAEAMGVLTDGKFNVKRAEEIAARAAANPDGDDAAFLKGITLGDEHLPKTATEIRDRLDMALDPSQASERLQTYSRATLERGSQEIPEWVRDKDLGRLATGWASDVFTHLRTRDARQELIAQAGAIEAAASKAEKSGVTDSRAGEASQWIRNLLADVGGARGDTFWGQAKEWATAKEAQVLKSVRTLERRAKEAKAAGQGFKAKSLEFRADVRRELANPIAVLSKMTANMYPAYLGARSFSAIRNSLQWPTIALPELGGRYGASVGVRALARLAKDHKKYRSVLKDDGLAPPSQLFEAEREIRKGVAESQVGRAASWMVRGVTDLAMFFYTKADSMNRVLTAASADVLADDALKAVQKIQEGGSVSSLSMGEKRAAALVRSLGAGYRNEVGAALRAGDGERAAKSLRAYLNGKTQFNYNRASLHEFGREMGPLLAMFSKWPTSVGADIAQLFVNRGGDADIDAFRRAQRLSKWMWPAAVLAGAEVAIQESGLRDSPRAQLAVGTGNSMSSNLAGLHPLSAMAPFASGRAFPPLISETMAVFDQGSKGNFKGAAKRFGNALLNVTPAGLYYNVATKELPLWLGEEPER